MNKIDCSKVYVSKSNIPNTNMYGAFANVDIKECELIEKGIMCRIECKDGMNNPHVFTWSDDFTNKTWAFGSGCITFYNTSNNSNCILIRDFDTDTFEVYANKDIKKGEELTHKYKSLKWRTCFSDLNKMINK